MTITVNLNEEDTRLVQSSADIRGLTIDEFMSFIIKKQLQEEISSENPNEITLAAMKAAYHDENMSGPFDTVAELMEALNA